MDQGSHSPHPTLPPTVFSLSPSLSPPPPLHSLPTATPPPPLPLPFLSRPSPFLLCSVGSFLPSSPSSMAVPSALPFVLVPVFPSPCAPLYLSLCPCSSSALALPVPLLFQCPCSSSALPLLVLLICSPPSFHAPFSMPCPSISFFPSCSPHSLSLPAQMPQQQMALLNAFPPSSRFPILLGCMPVADKKRLSKLWDESLAASNPATATHTTLQQARTKYKLPSLQ
ncbi:unnamed protein product [Closterium sp. Naga37s-1]|nr:unnamed protein product [Closterium sp. Naga37s-1]